MKKMIFILMITCLFTGLKAQNPCDATLSDKTVAHIGIDVTYLVEMPYKFSNGKEKYAFMLKKGLTYRLTFGNSKLTNANIIAELSLSTGDKNLIHRQVIAPGEFINFEYQCDKTQVYVLQIYSESRENACATVILSKVNEQ